MSEVDVDSQADLPRDVRLLHLLLASQSIQQYEDKVPLQLMDFAHRYTRGVLMDAMVYNDYAVENNGGAVGAGVAGNTASSGAGSGSGGKNAKVGATNTLGSGMSSNGGKNLAVEDIRLAIAARTQYMFKPTAPKELLLQLATERNKKPLPQVMGSWGVRLPPEKYCLSAKSWELDNDKSTE
ncbi:Transcription initiation factor TFIID subunit 9 [Nakaseomyces bracarensis]|uniref:Transcription initiation factor TFIID subunit 9 n=1 Tax=Nakaseomyces bracarensis TaxID=273131 RepID=A0ABR4NRS6_9SACH